jgi:hypothetical protein
MPGNVALLNSIIVDIATFNIVPTQNIVTLVFTFDSINLNPFNDNFNFLDIFYNPLPKIYIIDNLNLITILMDGYNT